ncbi:XRE family transcriptional regulator [Paenibacillus sp. FSL L8-0506]|uniref:XRE family transcriptional regulator n=1 Tax=Paenibacillus sp. FSL L8-0506 TaxID=2975335 RepID=UPI0030F8B66D
MFPNLRAEMARIGIDGVDVSTLLECTSKTFSRKMTGKGEFTRAEIFKIKNAFFPNLTIEYLFKTQKKHTA